MAPAPPPAPNLTTLIRQGAMSRGLDPRAVLAVAGQEGLSGRVGDNGTSFGPWQLHQGGALPRSIPLSQAQAWATSQPGLNYALDRIGSVAKGLKGSEAVNAIVRQFERPADPNSEVSRALASYGTAAAGPSAALSPGSPSVPSAPAAGLGGSSLLGQLLNQTNEMVGLGSSPTIASLLSGPATAAPAPPAASRATTSVIPGSVSFQGDTAGEQPRFLSSLAQAVKAVGGTQVRVTSGYRSPQHNAAVGGVPDSNHTTGDALDGEVLIGGQWVPLGVALRPVAPRYGLRSGAVPGFFNGRPDFVHVDDGRNQR